MMAAKDTPAGDRPIGLVGSPSPRATRLYRLLLGACRLVGRTLGFRLELEGAEHLPRTPAGLPAGGWIAAALPHRTWIDPFVVATLVPTEPRLVYLGDGRAIFRSPLRRLVFRAIGGVVPIWPGGGRRAVEAHIAGARAAVTAGAVFALFPEVGGPVPVGRARPLGDGLGYFALRTGAPVVPLVIGGTDELYLGRQIVLRVLPPVSGRELAGLPDGAPLPEPWSPAERAAARAIVREFHRRTAAAVEEAHRSAMPSAGARKRWTWLTHLFR